MAEHSDDSFTRRSGRSTLSGNSGQRPQGYPAASRNRSDPLSPGFTDWDNVIADLFQQDSLDARLQPGVTSYHDNPPPAMSTFKAPFERRPGAPSPGTTSSPRPPSILVKAPQSSETDSLTSSEKSVTFSLATKPRTIHDVSKAVDCALRAMTPEHFMTSPTSDLTSSKSDTTSDRISRPTSVDPAMKRSSTPNFLVTTATVHASHSSFGYHDDRYSPGGPRTNYPVPGGDESYYPPIDDHGQYRVPPIGDSSYCSGPAISDEAYFPINGIGEDSYYCDGPTSDYSSGNLSSSSQRDILDSQTAINKRKSRLSALDLLPDHCLIRVLSHLSTVERFKCSRINRRFYGLVWEPSLWTNIHITPGDYFVDSALKVLTTRLSFETPSVCMGVQTVVLNGCTQLTDKGLRYLSQRCPELVRLEIVGCASITNWALFEVVSNCTNLQYLDTTGCTAITCISLTPEAALRARPLRNKQILLRHLDLTDCTNLEDSGLSIIASHCTQLVNLYLRRCAGISDIGVQYVAAYCSSLRELSVCDCRRLTDLSLRELSKLETSLRYLSVAKCDRISDLGVKYLAHYCQRLRYLNLRGCEAVSDTGIMPIAKNCTRLKSLDIGKCDVSDDALICLANHCDQLKKLSVKGCEGVSDTGVTVLARKCPQLEQLNIQECHLSLEAYKAVKRHCKRCVIEHTNPGFC